MNKQYYRLRSLKSIFEFNELENQEIYFASLDELNDPMEGFRNMVFKGDKIVWKNFFRHYLRCLESVCQAYLFLGEQKDPSALDFILPTYAKVEDFSTTNYKELFDGMNQEFIQVCNEVIEALSRRTIAISREELFHYLWVINFIAIGIIQKHYIRQGLKNVQEVDFSRPIRTLKMFIVLIDNVEKIILENKEQNESLLIRLWNAHRHIMGSAQLDILQHAEIAPTRKFIILDFADFYLQRLENFMYPECYTASFMKEVHNSSVWGHYGDKHQGICLIFKSDLELCSKDRACSKDSFRKVNYRSSHDEINFFETIARMPLSALISTWYTDENNNKSPLFDKMLEKTEYQRESYWNECYKYILTKTKDWKYEKEYRIVIDGFMDDKIDKQNRKFKYRFKDLSGIIFGIRTSMHNKIKIKKIIEEKCQAENRQDFKFYQAYYCKTHNNIQYMELPKWKLS